MKNSENKAFSDAMHTIASCGENERRKIISGETIAEGIVSGTFGGTVTQFGITRSSDGSCVYVSGILAVHHVRFRDSVTDDIFAAAAQKVNEIGLLP